MMSILDAAGVAILSDGRRAPDRDNPRGYYEFERVKDLATDHGWLEEAKGRAVKVIYRLLPLLPASHRYDVLFMEREASEIAASQAAMMRRLASGEAAELDGESFMRAQSDELARFDRWLGDQEHLRVQRVNYNGLLEAPVPVLEGVREFLALRVDTAVMRRPIDPALYRNRTSNGAREVTT